MSDLDLLLSVPQLLKLVEQFPSFTEPLPFTKLFMMGGLEQGDGDRLIFEKIRNDRRLGGVRGPESEAFSATAPNRKVIEQGFIHSAEKEIIHPKELFLRAGPGTFMRANAENVVVRAVQRITSRLLRNREYVCARLLQNTAGVTLSAANTDFPTGSITINNTVTIDGGLQTLAATAPWSVATTKMLSGGPNQLPNFHRTLESNGFEAFRLIVNRAVAAAISGNLEAQTWLTTLGGVTIETIQRALQARGRQGEPGYIDPFAPNVFSGLGGIPNWHTWDHGFENGAATFTRYLADGIGILLPQDLTGVLGFGEGPVFVPSSQQVIGDASQAAELFMVRRGIQLYAYRTVDDTGNLVIVGRDTFVPIVRNELGILSLSNLAS
jgi:hypothetical protein